MKKILSLFLSIIICSNASYPEPQLDQGHTSLAFGTNTAPQDIERSVEDEKISIWLNQQVFNPQQALGPCATNVLTAFEILSGIGRGAVFFKLGFNLGERILEHVPTPGKEILSSIYGLGVFVPMAVLGSNLSSKVFKALLFSKSNIDKEIEKPCGVCKRVGIGVLKSPVIVAGLLSAPPMTYITYLDLHEVISWGWIVPAIPTFYVRSLIDYYSITSLLKQVYAEIKTPLNKSYAKKYPASRHAREFFLQEKCQQAKQKINSTSYEESSLLNKHLKNALHSKEATQALFFPEEALKKQLSTNSDSLKKKLFGYLGGIIGGYGMWIYYPAAPAAFSAVFSVFGVSNEPLAHGLGVVSTLTASSLTALATWSSAHKFYDLIANTGSFLRDQSLRRRINQTSTPEEESPLLKNTLETDTKLKWKRGGAASMAIFFAACNAAMQSEVALELLDMSLTSSKFNLTAAIIASFSTCFWAVDEALLDYLKAGDPRSPLLRKIDTIMQKVSSLSEEHFSQLESLIQDKSNTNTKQP